MPDTKQCVLISLSSFGAAEVRRHGQAWFADLSVRAGADGIEVRGELLSGAVSEFADIVTAAPGGCRVYSSAEPLYVVSGELNTRALEGGLEAARALGAGQLKMSIGSAKSASAASLEQLMRRLADERVELLIENDQTPDAGSLGALHRFLARADEVGLTLGMTFDIGNWHWVGECPLEAARAFASRVRYVHCKGVQRLAQRWIAVPITESSAPWRSVLRAMPAGLPWAIEYPLAGDNLLEATQSEIAQLRAVTRSGL